jgi:hypothetical protein
LISTSILTDFKKARCEEIKSGMKVHVKGLRFLDGHVEAAEVERK